MKQIFRKSVLFTSKLDAQTVRSMVFVGTIIIFSLIAGAPLAGGGNGG